MRYVLEGSAQRSGTRVSVRAQLIDADTSAHLWPDQFDADRADLLAMQDAIVMRLARALEIELAAAVPQLMLGSRVSRSSGGGDRADKAMRLSPFDPYLAFLHLFNAVGCFMLHRDDDAIGGLRRAVANSPKFPAAVSW